MVIVDKQQYLSEEEKRLKDDRERKKYWKKWGPYVAERQWATGKPFNALAVFNSLTDSQSVKTTRKSFGSRSLEERN
jgi:hypothetical protein